MTFAKLLSPTEVAEILGLSVQTLAVWRHEQRYDLPYVKSGRLVRYDGRDVEAFIKARRHAPLVSTLAPKRVP
jgi:excisionase family DNA binding protein